MGKKQGAEKRVHKRVTLVEDLYFNSQATRPLVDLSERGMFVATAEPYAMGSILELRFKLFDDEHEIRAQGRVIYVLEGLGMGLQFVEISHQDRERIHQFLQRF
jgi:Tfp pilus assembly protein PilZ